MSRTQVNKYFVIGGVIRYVEYKSPVQNVIAYARIACLLFMLLQLVETAIYLPSSLFQEISSDVNYVKFQFIVYSNSKLFPEITNGSETEQTSQVFTSVVSAQFGESLLFLLTLMLI